MVLALRRFNVFRSFYLMMRAEHFATTFGRWRAFKAAHSLIHGLFNMVDQNATPDFSKFQLGALSDRCLDYR